MAIPVTNSNEGNSNNFLAPAGNHVARCYKMIHYGRIPIKDKVTGVEKIMNKVRIEWELPNETHEFKEGDGQKPYSVGKDYTLSLFDKANLRTDLKSWRGKDFTEDELKSFDISRLLGVSCMINVIHTEDGKYANVSGITPLPKGLVCPKQINDSFEFGFNPFDQSKLDSLPKWQQDKIKSSVEYKALENHHMDEHTKKIANSTDEADDLPF